MVIRGMWDETKSSDTRLLDSPLIPDRLVTVGRSKAYAGKGRREHVVPRRVLIMRIHEMLDQKASDEAIADFIMQHNKIVLVTNEEARRMDSVTEVGLRQDMPDDWSFGGNLYRRLEMAEIEWEPI